MNVRNWRPSSVVHILMEWLYMYLLIKKIPEHQSRSAFNASVFQVCDEPHPLLIKDMLSHCVNGEIDEAYKVMSHLWRLGYSPIDIITIVFRVCKTHSMPEFLKLEFIKVRI